MLRNVERRVISLPERGVDIALIDWGGDGPLTFLHHANGFCAGLWGVVAERLRGDYRVIAMDARGHGDSSRPAKDEDYVWSHFIGDLIAVVERVLDDLGCERVETGIGHSFGGTCTAMAASQRPELFGRVAMVDPVIMPPAGAFEMPDRPRSPMVEIARKRREIWPSRAAVRKAWTRPGHNFASWDPRALELYLREGFRDLDDGTIELKCAGAVEAAIYENNQSLSPFERAPFIEAETLVLWGALGHFPRAIFEGFVDLLPNGRLEDVAGGHLLPMEAPDLTADALLRFMG